MRRAGHRALLLCLVGCGTHAQAPSPTPQAAPDTVAPLNPEPQAAPAAAPELAPEVAQVHAPVVDGTLRFVVMHEDPLTRSAERDLASLTAELERRDFDVSLVTEPSEAESAFLRGDAALPEELATFEYIVSMHALPNGEAHGRPVARGFERLTIHHLPTTTPAFHSDTTVYSLFSGSWVVDLLAALDAEQPQESQ